MIQGGILYSGSSVSPQPTQIADEFNSALTFNIPGLLAMANAGPNTGSSEFFITAPGISQTSMPNSNWNFQYAIFGELTSGFNIYNDILNTPLSSGTTTPTTPVTFTASISSTTTQAGVVQISEPSDFTGSATITITATGSDSSTAQTTFTVNSTPPSASSINTGTTGVNGANPLVLSSAATNLSTSLVTAEGTAVTLPITANLLSNFAGGTFTYSVLPAANNFADPPFTSSTGNNNVAVTVTPNGSSAVLTLTPGSSFNGTLNLIAQVDYSVTLSGQTIPLRDDLPFTLTVTPTAPTVVTSTGAKIGAASQ